jgi:hypothetical protein
MRMNRTILALCVLACTLTALRSMSQAQAPPKQPPPEWSTWLVRVHYVHRQNPARDEALLTELRAQLEAADKPADKRRIQRRIDDANKEADQRRGHVIYGWSVHADAAGKPLDASRALTGFFVAHSSDNAKAIASLKPGAALALDRAGSTELFTLGGRRWRAVQRAAIIRNAADIGDPPQFKAPPDAPLSDAEKRSLAASLTFHGSKPTQSGGVSHRYTIKVNAESAANDATSFHLWLALSVSADGALLGPILEHLEVPRTQAGNFAISQSSDLIARPGVTIDGDASSLEPVAMSWNSQ